MLKNCRKFLWISFSLNFQHEGQLKIENLVLKVEEPDETNKTLRFSATFPCPHCKKKLELRMTSKVLVSSERGRLGWSLSNFQCHMKLHFKPEAAQSSEKEPQSPLMKFIINSANVLPISLASGATNDASNDVNTTIDCERDSVPKEDVVTEASNKRKHHVISDDDDEDDHLSGKGQSGMLTEQNIPEMI